MARLTDQQYIAGMGFADDGAYERFEVAPGKFMQYRAATPAEYVRYLIRRIPAERASFVNGVRIGQEIAKAQAAAEEAGTELVPGTEPDFDMVQFVETRIDSGPEGMAALVCICTDMPGNAALENRWISHPRLQEFYAACKVLTEGANPDDFFARVAEIVWGKTTRPDASSKDGSAPSEASESQPAA